MIDCGDFSIVELQLEDASSLSAMLLKNTKRFQRFFSITLAENQNLEMSKTYIQNKKSLIDKKKEYSLAIKVKASKNIAGLIIIKNIDRKIKDAEIAYCLDVKLGNRGIMTKAVDEICRFAKDQCELNSLYILTHKSNEPSVRVAEKSGFTWGETKIKSYTPINETEALDMEKYVKIL